MLKEAMVSFRVKVLVIKLWLRGVSWRRELRARLVRAMRGLNGEGEAEPRGRMRPSGLGMRDRLERAGELMIFRGKSLAAGCCFCRWKSWETVVLSDL